MGKRAVEVEETMNVGMRIPIAIVKELDKIVEKTGSNRSAVARDLVMSALRARKDPRGEDWEMKYQKLMAQNELLRELLDAKN